MKTVASTSIVLLASLCFEASAFAIAAAPSAAVPLIQGLTIVSAASERQGDYESTMVVANVDQDGAIRLTTSSELPDPAGSKPTPASFDRDVLAADLTAARTYKYMFSAGEEQFPGTTAMGASAAVIADLRAGGKATINLDGQIGGLGGLVSGLLGLLPGNESMASDAAYLTATGIVHAVEPRPIAYPMMLNNVSVSLSAWHVKGSFQQAGVAVPVEWFILDDPKNALTLRFAFGKDKVEVVRIGFPAANETKNLENELAAERRAVIYGIYFDFNSATIKPASNAVLNTITSVMKNNPQWHLGVEGHTDNIGGDMRNLDLSARRAAAVRAALVERGLSEERLTTSGRGAAAPRDTNTTLVGRAHNRRVELTRL